MPKPLRWDTPGLKWDSGLKWDGFMPDPPRKKMNNTKAIIDFSSYTASELGPVAQAIHDEMLANAAIFTAPPTTMAALQTLITSYNSKLVARASRASADIIAFNEAREALEAALGALGNYTNTVAQGDPMLVDKSGFPSYLTTRTPDLAPPAAPAAPQNLRLLHGDVSGSIFARYKSDRQQSTNEVQTNTGDPNAEGDWKMKGIFQGGRADLSGLTPGAVVWVRVRTVGLKGVMGAWSDPGQIRVL